MHGGGVRSRSAPWVDARRVEHPQGERVRPEGERRRVWLGERFRPRRRARQPDPHRRRLRKLLSRRSGLDRLGWYERRGLLRLGGSLTLRRVQRQCSRPQGGHQVILRRQSGHGRCLFSCSVRCACALAPQQKGVPVSGIFSQVVSLGRKRPANPHGHHHARQRQGFRESQGASGTQRSM